MEDVIVRSRYPRRSVHSKKRKRNLRENSTITEKIARQTVICILILIFVGIVKSVNTPATNFIMQKTKWALSQNIELKSIYEGMNDIFNKVVNNKDSNKENTDSARKQEDLQTDTKDESALPASTGAYTPGNKDVESEDYEKALQDEQKNDLSKNARGSTDGSRSSQASNQGAEEDNTVQGQYGFIVPVKGVVGEPFGERIHPIKKTVEFHKGIDIEAAKGSQIKAVQAGEVIEAGKEPTYGNYIKIKHSDGFTTLYAHCSVLNVKKGQKVKQGDVIAKVGDTGLSIGAHLHFEIWKDEKPVDPLKYIKVPVK